MGLFGREHELAALRGALAAAATGAGRLVLVSGEAGVGKSRLIDELLRDTGSAPVARGYAVDDEGAPALWPWTRLLRALPAVAEVAAPATDAVLSGAAQRFQLFAALVDALVAAAEPDGLVLVLEDVHWADRSSLLLLRQLGAELAASRLLVVASHRPPSGGPLAELEPDLLRGPAALAVPLDGLGPDAVRAWLAELLGPRGADPELAALLHRRAGGNALFVRLLAEAVPSGGTTDAVALRQLTTARPQLRRLVTARTAALSATTRHLLRVAAVLGERIPHSLLPGAADLVADQVDAALDEAARAGVLGESPDVPGIWVFTHALVRDAIYDDLDAAERVRLHRMAARAIEADDTLPGRAGRIATQWRRAGSADDLRRCAYWAGVAAADAAATAAVDEAVLFADLALATATAAGATADERAELLLRLAEAHYAAGSTAEAMRRCVEAADATTRPELVAAAALVVRGIGDPQTLQHTLRLAHRALDLIDAGDDVVRCSLLAQLATAEADTGQLDAALEHSAQALAVAESTGDPDAVLDAIRARHLTLSVPERVTERLALGRRAVEVGPRARQPLAELWGHLYRALAAFQLGNLPAADEEVEEVQRVAVANRSTLARWHLLRLRVMRSALTGDFAVARELDDEAAGIAARMGDMSAQGMSYAFRMQLATTTGDPAELGSAPGLAIRSAATMPLVRSRIPLLHLLHGETDAAAAAFEEFRELPATLPYGVRWAATLCQLGVIAVGLDDREVAEVIYRRLLPIEPYYTGDGSGAVYSSGANARVLGELAVTAGLLDEAVRHHGHAITMNARIGARPFLAQSRLGLGLALHRRGRTADRDTARAEVVRAAAEFRRLDMPGPLRAADALLVEIDAARRAADPLSAREREIASLIADGLSNREIAARLVLSERTVETHVRNALAKLGCANRTEIATWAVRSGLGG